MGDKRREREKRGGSEMHVSPLHTRSALVTCIILRWFMRPRYVSARVFILSLSLSLLADPSAIFSVSVARSRSLLHSLGARCVHVSRVAEGRVQEGARHGEMGGREKRMRWECWLAKGGRGARAVLSACVSDVLMTLRNTEQANQYGSRHSACALAALSRPFSRYWIGLSPARERERGELARGGEKGKRRKWRGLLSIVDRTRKRFRGCIDWINADRIRFPGFDDNFCATQSRDLRVGLSRGSAPFVVNNRIVNNWSTHARTLFVKFRV